MYTRIDGTDYWAEIVDEKVVRTVCKSELVKAVDDAKTRLLEIPADPTDEDYIAWAKANMPRTDYSVEKSNLERIILENQIILDQI